MNDILKEEHLPMHYTVDRLNGTDRFIINMYFPDNPEELIVISANIEGVGLNTKRFRKSWLYC